MQSTINRSTDFQVDFVAVRMQQHFSTSRIYARNQTNTFRLNGSLTKFNKKF